MPTTTRAKSRPLSRSCPASRSPKPRRRTLMSISYQFGDVDAHGAMIRSQAASLEAEHQSIVRDVLAAGDFWGGSGSVACQEFITQLGRNFQVIYQQANSHGQKVQTAGNNMSSTDSAVGSTWAYPPQVTPPPVARTPTGVRATTLCKLPGQLREHGGA